MKTYKVVIVGAGRIGAFFDDMDCDVVLTHAHAFQEAEQFELVGFFDVVEEVAKKAAERWKVRYFHSLEEAMQDVDVVCCTVPDAYHYDMLKQIAQYPVKFVFSEKPITETPEQAEKICKLYQEKKLPLQINYTRRYLEEFVQLKRDMKGYGTFLKGCGYYGKGILHNGSHMLDLIIYLLGSIESVEGDEKIFDFFDEDPSVEAKIKVRDGNIYLHPIDCRVATIFELELFFEKARVRILDGGSVIEIYPVMPSPVYEGYENYIKKETRIVHYDNSFRNAVQNIYEHLEYQKELCCPMEDAKVVLELCCKLQQ